MSDESAAGSTSIPYRLPPAEVVAVVEAEPTPALVMSPDGKYLLLGHYDALPSIEQQAEPILKLAGVRFRPRFHEWQRAYYYTRLELLEIATGKILPIELPEGAKLGRPLFSADAQRLAFTRTVDDGVELWTCEVPTRRAKRLLPAILNDTLGGSYGFIAGTHELMVRLLVDGRGEPPQPARVPLGPIVEDTAGKRATNRTFQDLLQDAHDEAMFEHHTTAQLARVAQDGTIVKLGTPGIFLDVGPSPNGQYVLIERVTKPYSHSVPISRFGHTIEVLDREGHTVAELARIPTAEEVPIQGVPQGMRGVHWQPLVPATITYVEALDGGDPKRAAEFRDEISLCHSPRFDSPIRVGRTKQRFVGMEWIDRRGCALVSEWDRDRRWITTTLRDVTKLEHEPKVIFDRSQNDRYGDPGELVFRRTSDNSIVARVEGDSVFLAGEGATAEGDRPFLDRLNLATLEKTRLFHSTVERYASFVQFVPSERGPHQRFIFRRESRTEPANYFVRTVDDASERVLTTFPDPHPQLTGIEKHLITYTRADGVALSGTLYLPPGRRPGERLPLVIWAYPLEYNDAQTAGQVNAQPNRFTRLSGISPLMFLLRGFAVLDDATMPIVGDPETVNDTFIQQCVDSMRAAIDAVVARGDADRDRVAVGGHSYGAFMTANLLAHSDLFRAGIARSGAYNRTLTPFGFQGERRTMWEARDTYLAMSPLLVADRIKSPLLLIHGDVDDNPGTHTLQTKRLFHALQGLGGTARMVLLPHEAHGYVARESVLHVLAESIDWLERYLAPRG